MESRRFFEGKLWLLRSSDLGEFNRQSWIAAADLFAQHTMDWFFQSPLDSLGNVLVIFYDFPCFYVQIPCPFIESTVMVNSDGHEIWFIFFQRAKDPPTRSFSNSSRFCSSVPIPLCGEHHHQFLNSSQFFVVLFLSLFKIPHRPVNRAATP